MSLGTRSVWIHILCAHAQITGNLRSLEHLDLDNDPSYGIEVMTAQCPANLVES